MATSSSIYLVPGFMSPAWMMYPLQRYLTGTVDFLVRWDYPRVFADLDTTIDSLATELESRPAQSVSIVAHSFGDWIVRSALNRTKHDSVTRLISVCPVMTSVPVAKLVQKITGDLIPEFVVMASNDRAGISISADARIERRCIWARAELLVTRPDDRIPDRQVWATHNSALLQPNVWKAIHEELNL